jgi:hypothetical protein
VGEKNGKPRTKISLNESKKIEQQEDPMKYLHGVVAVHVKRNNLDQAASSFPFCREFSRNHLEWA